MKIKISFILIFLLSASTALASQAGQVKQGNKLFLKGDYDASLAQYKKALEKDPDSSVIHFNTSAAQYKKGDYEAAIDGLQKALLADDKILQGNAHYNLGNTFYQIGKSKEEKELPVAIESMEKSLQEYEKVLSLNKEDKEASDNYAFVKKELERLKIKQEQQKQQQDKEKKEQNNEQKQCPLPQQQKNEQEKKNQEQQSQENEKKEGEKKKEEEQGQNEESEQEKSQQQQSSASSGEMNKDQQEQKAVGQKKDEKQMNEQQAQRLLQQYQQQEEPKGLLNFVPQNIHGRTVEKDW